MANISHIHQEMLTHFSALPDCALVRLPVVMSLFSVSRATIWRWVADSKIPAPKKIGSIAAWSVGELKKTLKEICDGNSVQ